jgi:hypothetical protein
MKEVKMFEAFTTDEPFTKNAGREASRLAFS